MRPVELVTEEATKVLIREARRRQRRRRLIIVAALFILATTIWFTAKAIGVDSSGPSGATASPRSPARPMVATGQFGGTWRVHTTSVTIHGDGRGSVIWPGPLEPGESEATAAPEPRTSSNRRERRPGDGDDLRFNRDVCPPGRPGSIAHNRSGSALCDARSSHRIRPLWPQRAVRTDGRCSHCRPAARCRNQLRCLKHPYVASDLHPKP